MKNLVCIILLLIFLCGCAAPTITPPPPISTASPTFTPAPTPKPSYDFRKITWGMNMDEVKNSETLSLNESNNEALLFSGAEISHLPANVYYKFGSGGLSSSAYLFTHSHTNKTDFINDYNTIKSALIEKYGQPLSDKIDWKDDLYKDDPQDYGMAVAVGDLQYFTTWQTDRTKITLGLRGDNYKISFIILYNSTVNLGPAETTDISGL